MMQAESLPIQNDRPEIVYIFGAGASYPEGVPIQSDIIPLILDNNDIQLEKSPSGRHIREFLHENFSTKEKFPSLEEVFGFIDFHINNDFSLTKKWNKQDLIQLRIDFIKVLHYIISSKTQTSKDFQFFWQQIKHHKQKIGVITTNYDTLIDEAFDIIYPDYLIDYCIDLVNCRYDAAGPDWWLDPQKPTKFNGLIPIRTKLIKIHGSLNWKYCNCCAQVKLTPWQHRINLKLDSFESFFNNQSTICPFDKSRLTSLIQAPSHLKTNHNYIFNKLYDEASYLVRNSKILVFIGYSFPEADVHIRALIKRNFDSNKKIVVINKSSSKDLFHRYISLSNNVTYNEMTFEKFLKSKIFNDLINVV